MIKEKNSVESYAVLKKSKNVLLVDVRSILEDEYVGHPTNSVNIPIMEPPDWGVRPEFRDEVKSELEKQFPNVSDHTEIQILLLCRSGKRSEKAASLLCSAGYKNVINITDGFEGDKDANGHRSVINGWRFNKLPWEQG